MQKIKKELFFLYGKHPVFQALKSKKRSIFNIFINQNNKEELKKFLQLNSLTHLFDKIKIVDNNFIESKISYNKTHQGYLLSCSNIEFKSENQLISDIQNHDNQLKLPTILILDQLTDPQNVGSIIRSAKAFNVDKIVFCENNSCKETAIMVKSSVGAIELVDLFMVTNINKLIQRLKKLNYWCFGLDGESKNNVNNIQDYNNIILIIGSEGKGIRPLVKKNCDLLLQIPINSQIESLNASVACSIALYEINKKNN